MIQHPIPQNVSTYQFRLIGDMTIKQFMLLAIGLGLAFLIYSTNLFTPLKLLLAAASAFLGVGMAFMPLEERSLDQWILSYLKAIYNPTQFFWHKTPKEPSYFTFTPLKTTQNPSDLEDMAKLTIARKQAGLSSFLQTLPQDAMATTLEAVEKNQLLSIQALFNPQTPSFAPRHSVALTGVPASPAIAARPTPTPTLPGSWAPDAKLPSPAPTQTLEKPKPHFTPAMTGVVPQTPISLPKTQRPQTLPAPATPPLIVNQPQSQTLIKKTTQDAAHAAVEKSLPFPSTPKTPNTIVGMVLDPAGNIIENAIVEIRDQQGLPVRATKTNKLGQFFSTTPLKNGVYEMEVESPHHQFAILKLALKGKIIDPLKITAK